MVRTSLTVVQWCSDVVAGASDVQDAGDLLLQLSWTIFSLLGGALCSRARRRWVQACREGTRQSRLPGRHPKRTGVRLRDATHNDRLLRSGSGKCDFRFEQVSSQQPTSLSY